MLGHNDCDDLLQKSRDIVYILCPKCPSCDAESRQLLADVRTLCARSGKVTSMVVLQGNSRWPALHAIWMVDNPGQNITGDQPWLFFRQHWYRSAPKLMLGMSNLFETDERRKKMLG